MASVQEKKKKKKAEVISDEPCESRNNTEKHFQNLF